ncbi:MAG: choice-of-anchor U domain-containing protein [Dehalococcoidia bacterium]
MKRITSILLALALVLGFSLVATTPVAAAILTVDTGQANTPPNYWTIQAAIDAANLGDTINVAAGTYTEYLHITTDGLTIQGAGIDQSIIDLDGLTPYWHYSGSGSFASRAGVLISGYGSSGEVIEDVTFKGFTVKNAGLNPPTTATGTHTGLNNQLTTLTDNTKAWTPGALVGQWVHNYGDRDTDYNPARSYGQITVNTATTVTVASLSGGKENDWDTGDQYLITPYEEFHNKIWVHYPNYDGLRGIGIGNGKNILIQNCKVTNCGYGGIGSGYARLVSTHKYSELITVDNCIVTDHLTSGISIGQNVGALTITNNLVERNKRPNYEDATRENAGRGIEVSGSKYGYGPASGLIADNTVNDNGFEGIILASYTDGVTVEDNTVTGHNLDEDGAGIFFYGASSNPANCKNNIIKNNTVTGNIRGIVAYYAQACTIEGNTITTDSGAFALGQAAIKIDGGNNIAVKDNTISCDGAGIKVQKTWNSVDCYANTFTCNTITGAKFAGVRITAGAHDNTFTCNTITGTTSLTIGAETQADGVFIDDDAGTGNVFNGNSIYGNADDGMENQIGAQVDAENNWWGCDGGPGAAGCDTVVGNVDYDPWASASSVATATGTGTASFAAPCGSISGLTSIPEGSLPAAAQATKPINFPDGLFSFTITGLTAGQTVAVIITLPPGAAPTQYWKYHAPNWVQIPMTVVGPPNVIRITLVDGGLGDDDGLANGTIVDQGGPGSGAVGWETYPINKVRVLLPWIALFAAIMAGASLLVLRRRRA